MWFILGPIIGIAIIALALWLRYKYVMDTIRFYGVGGTMSGIYAYRKYGIWHFGCRYTEK